MALWFAAGIVLANWVEVSLGTLFVITLGLGSLALCRIRLRPLLLPAFIFFSGWAGLAWREAPLSPCDLRALVGDRTEWVAVRGRVSGPPSQRVVERDEEEFWRVLAPLEVASLRVKNGPWQPAVGRLQTSTRGQDLTNFFAGQTVEVTGVLSPPPGALAEGLFDYRAYLRRLGIYYQLQIEGAPSWRVVGSLRPRPWTDRFRAWAQGTLARGLPVIDEPLKLQWAMVLGWKTALTDEVSEPFMRSGTMHIFAISGLHIALIAVILAGLLRLVNVPRSFCGVLIIPLVWFYTAATEWQASAIRSTIMTTVIIMGWSLRRPSDLVNSLAAAALIILLWDPAQLFQAGFQLSFGAVLSLALVMPILDRWRFWLLTPHPEDLSELALRWSGLLRPEAASFGIAVSDLVTREPERPSRARRWLVHARQRVRGWMLVPDPFLPERMWTWWQRRLLRVWHWLLQALCVSLAATLGTAPLIAHYFHLFSPVSLLANLVVVPLSGLALMSGLGGLICGAWAPWAAELFNHAGWFFMSCMAGVSEWMAALPGACWQVRAPGLVFLLLYYAALVSWLSGGFRPACRRWTVACLAGLSLLWLATAWIEHRTTRLAILPLRDAHAVWLDRPGQAHDWLIDCGDAYTADRVTIPFLRGQGVDRLSHLLLTHGDVRHVGGATNVFDRFSVRRLYASPARFLSRPYRAALSSWTNRHGAFLPVQAGEDRGPWEVLHPRADDTYPRADDKAVVLRGDFNGTRVVLFSDLGIAGQSALMERTTDLRADIVIAGCPADAEPLPDALLDALRPRMIVIVDEARPPKGWSRPKLELRLGRRGVPVLYTREHGAITITFHRRRALVETMDGSGFEVEPPAARQEEGP